MTTWLRRIEYRTKRAGIRANVGCSELICLKLEQRLEEMADRHGQRVAIVGQSRGGIFAKALGARRPDLVSGVVTLGSPLTNQLAVHPIVLAQVGMVAALGTLWMPGC
jgi:pimeloyl-ACP methyl ester carboxylesterase